MATECDGSSSATIYFRAKGAAEYERFYTENCPVDVRVASGGPYSPIPGRMYNNLWGFVYPVDELNLNAYGVNSMSFMLQIAPWSTGFFVLSDFGSYKVYFPSAIEGWERFPSYFDPILDSGASEPRPLYGFKLLQVRLIDENTGFENLVWDALTGAQSGGGKITITDSTGKVFEREISGEIEWYAACDCEEGCLPIYADEDLDEFICLCAEDDDEDIEKMKERIKQELLVELPPIIKSQLKAELVPELVQQLPENETFKGKVIDSVKSALTADDAFKNGIKDAVKAALIADAEFKIAMSDATKERFVSDVLYQKEWIDIIAAAIKAKQDGDANGYPMDVGGVEVRVKQEGNTPKSLSFAASASLTSSAIEDALAAKYGGAWSTSGYATANGKTTATITPI